MLDLEPGLKGQAELLVGREHTAQSVGSGKVGVLATPVMINVIEAAALAAVEEHLPAGHQSLGTYLEVSHVAATPVGMRVTAQAELVKVEGRLLHIRVSARDEVEEIGSGMHHRIVVNVARFDARVASKAARL
ncbi:MAG: thioesterase family protein [Methyloligellaceae bacterium]